MVSWDVYSDIIYYAFKNFHFLYKHNCIISVEGRSIILYIECLGGMFLREKILKVAQFDEF